VNLVTVEQIKELLQSYPDSAPLPIFVFDADYEPGQLAAAWGSLRAAAPTRLRAGRCFYADPNQLQRGARHDMDTSSPASIRPPGQNQSRVYHRGLPVWSGACVRLAQPACHPTKSSQAVDAWLTAADVRNPDPRRSGAAS